MRQEKQLLLDDIKDQLNRYNSFVIMNYNTFEANMANAFRREIKKLGGDVEFIRKRILIKAADSAGLKLDLTALPGHIGLVFAEDPLETAKAVIKYGQDHDKKVDVIGGRVEGQIYGADQMKMLSTLPSKDEMRAQLLATFEAPMSHTLSVIDAILTSVVYCLDNKSKQEDTEK